VFSTFTFIDVVQFAANLLVVTSGKAKGFTVRGYGDGVCGGVPCCTPVWGHSSKYGGLKTLPLKIFEVWCLNL